MFCKPSIWLLCALGVWVSLHARLHLARFVHGIEAAGRFLIPADYLSKSFGFEFP